MCAGVRAREKFYEIFSLLFIFFRVHFFLFSVCVEKSKVRLFYVYNCILRTVFSPTCIISEYHYVYVALAFFSSFPISPLTTFSRFLDLFTLGALKNHTRKSFHYSISNIKYHKHTCKKQTGRIYLFRKQFKTWLRCRNRTSKK